MGHITQIAFQQPLSQMMLSRTTEENPVPKGPCNFKTGLWGTCGCLRFCRVHRQPEDFQCDGCTHHSSYHQLDNPEEKQLLKSWTNFWDENSDKSANLREKRVRDSNVKAIGDRPRTTKKRRTSISNDNLALIKSFR